MKRVRIVCLDHLSVHCHTNQRQAIIAFEEASIVKDILPLEPCGSQPPLNLLSLSNQRMVLVRPMNNETSMIHPVQRDHIRALR